jgi:hypothetical protein
MKSKLMNCKVFSYLQQIEVLLCLYFKLTFNNDASKRYFTMNFQKGISK